MFYLIKSVLGLLGITPKDLRGFATRIGRLRPQHVINKLYGLVWKYSECRVYRRQDLDCANIATADVEIKKDFLSDLFLFEPTEPRQIKQDFLQQALLRLERGEHVYTYADQHKLLHYGWLIETQEKAYFPEVRQEFKYPKQGAVLYDFYTHPEARGRGLYQKAIITMLGDIRDGANVTCAYISCLADNARSQHVIEKLGFAYLSSLYYRRFLGLSAKW